MLAVLAASAADASCLSRNLGSNCFEPRGNSALSRPNQRVLPMREADPRIAPAPLPKSRAAPRLQRRGPFPTVNGRVLRHPPLGPCVGLSCSRQQRYFSQGCTSPRCL